MKKNIMATDGTKIIDGDTAHDTYWGIMDLYDRGADLEVIMDEFPIKQKEFFDEFDNEIYVTSCGLAYWEIGLMNAERLKYIQKIIEKDACVNEWASSSDKEGKSRKNVLKRYLTKIAKKNEKIRKRKKYKKITNFVFTENSALTFKLSTGEYAVAICVKIDQYRGNCNYWLVPTTFKSSSKPTLEELKKHEILGITIGSGYDKETTREQQPGIDRIWDYVGGNKKFFFGFVIDAFEHIDLLTIKNNFEKIGELNIINGLKREGVYGYEETFEGLVETYSNLEEMIKKIGFKKYPIGIVIDDSSSGA